MESNITKLIENILGEDDKTRKKKDLIKKILTVIDNDFTNKRKILC